MGIADDLDAARDAAVGCVWSTFNLRLMLGTLYRQALRDGSQEAVERFHGEAAGLFGKLAGVYERASEALTAGVVDALVLSSTATHGTVSVGRRVFATWHQAVVENVADFLLLPELEDGNGDAGFWKRVVEGVRLHPIGDPEELEAGLQDEWARARAVVTAKQDDSEMSCEPLTKRAEAVYQIIVSMGPVTGVKITEKTGIDQSTLTKTIIPELKRLRGIVNKRGAGYYSPAHYESR